MSTHVIARDYLEQLLQTGAKDLLSKLRADQLHLIGNAFLRSITRGAFGFGDAVFTGVCAVQ